MGLEHEAGVFAQKWNRALLAILAAAFLIAAPLVKSISAESLFADFSFARHRHAALVDTCAGGTLKPMAMPPIGAVIDLEGTDDCTVPGGSYYYYGNVNIYQKESATTTRNLS